MDFLRQWLLGIVACTFLASIFSQLSPEGSQRVLIRFASGLLLLCAMLRPLAQVELPALSWDAGEYRAAVAQLELELRDTEEMALSEGIASELASYIEDKAESLGASVQADVSMETRNGVPVPSAVTLRGAYNGELAERIETEIGIGRERQQWIES